MKGLGFYGRKFFVIKSGDDLISESITRIIMTSPGERLGQPNFGVGLKARLFNQNDELEFEAMESDIRDQLTIYEPRVIISSENGVSVQSDDSQNTLSIDIKFRLKDETPQDERFITITIAGVEAEG